MIPLEISNVLKLVRPGIARFNAYASARSLNVDGNIFLDANESPFGEFNRYPEPQPRKLRQRLADLYGVTPEDLLVGRGIDEAIDTLVRTFCESSRDAILICPPTYGMYQVAANLQGVAVTEVPLKTADFSVDIDAIKRALTPAVKLVFICSPNNPTGGTVKESQLTGLAEFIGARALLVIDEAYVEFAEGGSFTTVQKRYPNVVILRTLSKAWGLANVRCGVAIAHPKIIELMQKVRAPYPLSGPAVKVALHFLNNNEVAASVEEIKKLRRDLNAELAKLPCVEQIFPSEANFLLLRVRRASEMVAHCRVRGILIRDRQTDCNLENCVRITVGSESENKKLIEALRELASGI